MAVASMGERVRMESVSPNRLHYLVEGWYLAAANWLPIALAPASMANVQGGERLFLVSEPIANRVMQRAPAKAGGVPWRRVPR